MSASASEVLEVLDLVFEQNREQFVEWAASRDDVELEVL